MEKEIINKKEYILIKDNINYNISIYIENYSINIKCLLYEIKLNFRELSNLININFDTIQDEFNFIINLFINKNILIKEIIINNRIILSIKLNKNNSSQKQDFFLYLIYKKLNKDYIINELYNANINLEKEKKSMQLKPNIKNENQISYSDNINLKSIINIKSFTRNPKENSFTLFNSIDNILILVYGTRESSIISYNINDNQKISEIKNAHNDDIIGFNHFLLKQNKDKTDLIMSISALNFFKIWNAKNWECILYLEKINKMGLLSSACFVKNKENLCYIATCNSNYGVGTEKIKIFDIKGEKIKEINSSNEDSLFIDTYYDEEKDKIYIIVCSKSYVKSYDYFENKLYYKYFEKNNGHHFSAFIRKEKGITKLIESCSSDGFIRIWNFHYGNLLGKIATDLKICSLCFWNNNYLFSGTLDGKILIIDLINQIIFKTFQGHKNWVNYIRIFKNDKYGECLITQGFDDLIQIWSNIL